MGFLTGTHTFLVKLEHIPFKLESYSTIFGEGYGAKCEPWDGMKCSELWPTKKPGRELLSAREPARRIPPEE